MCRQCAKNGENAPSGEYFIYKYSLYTRIYTIQRTKFKMKPKICENIAQQRYIVCRV